MRRHTDFGPMLDAFQGWLDGVTDFDALPSEVQKAIDEMAAEDEEAEELAKGQPTMTEVHQGQANTPKKKRKPAPPMELLHKANEEQRFTLGPWYIPDKEDAHSEWTDANELQKALWDYVKSGDRNIRLQHNTDVVAGEWVEAMSFPVPVTLGMTKATGDSKEVTYPAGTVFLGVKWNDWAWDLVKQNKITGFSIGGSAARIDMSLPNATETLLDSARSTARKFVTDEPTTTPAPTLKDAMRAFLNGEQIPAGEPDDAEPIVKYNSVSYRVVPLAKRFGAGVVNVAGLYGDDDSVAVVRTDGERFWATGSGVLPKLDYAKAQIVLAEVAKAAKRFGSRSEAGRYAANVRWGRTRTPSGERGSSGIAEGSAPEPKTPEGIALGASGGGAPSLMTHCDLDAVAADMKAAGLKEPTADMYYKHLTPERRAEWDGIIAGSLKGVPTNPDGPVAYMMGGGAASGKSTAIKSGTVAVPNSDRKQGPVKAVDVNPDSVKEQLPAYKNMVANKDLRAAGYTHEESAQIAALTAVAGLRSKRDIVVDGVADNGAAKTMGKTDTYRSHGAKRVELHVVTADIETARERNVTRSKKTGRLVEDHELVKGHKGVSANFNQYAASGKWDVVTLLDTNGSSTVKAFEQRAGGKPKILNKAAFDRFIAKKDWSGN